ncbi:MAG: FAD-dependent oxidoreductase [Alphaproteobacteria bacterium]|nr:MAG: FAD-dependent oxidoreductase [Alphaproteobacteria bacterium]
MTAQPSHSPPSAPRVHIVGAGISGLACAVHLARRGVAVYLYEAAAQAGGRCRSYHDARLDCVIDNGNHMLLAANRAALAYVAEIGAAATLTGSPRACFGFVDLRSGLRWSIAPNAGPVPWWILAPRRRIPGTRVRSYLAALRLARADAQATVADCLARDDPAWERFWEPLTVAVLNTAPEEASARLLWRVVRETFLRGAGACRPLIARDGLGATFVDPALALLRRHGARIVFNRRLRALAFAEGRVVGLDFGSEQVPVGGTDRVVLAVPPNVATTLVPGLEAPRDARTIVNGHVRLPAPPPPSAGMRPDFPVLGLIGGTAQWLFLRGAVASLTVSAADAVADLPNDEIAARLWHDTAAALELPPTPCPPMRIIKERRATFAQTPAALARRVAARTAWDNLFLAGDWTDTGYPATIESAVRSGRTAAALVTKRSPIANEL